MHESAEQMDLCTVFTHDAFAPFAIDSHSFKSGNAQQAGIDSGIQSIDIGALQDATDGRFERGYT
ncbi:hypothetical protein [Acidithiobacillus ferrivorans]|uniref:hypothetical protein n=1 Tax=Acidithiobacillus ferrivorans TaxID=160808 RepID=UPI0012E06B36|nr:hypothetical protein [Acidithiobacillus ferrivorans]